MWQAVMIAMQAAPPVAAAPAAPPVAQPPRIIAGRFHFTRLRYPTKMPKEASGVVSMLITVSRTGHPMSCKVTETSGSTRFDGETCAHVVQQGRFVPATTADGRPVAGEYRMAGIWIRDASPLRSRINLTVDVASIPRGYRSPAQARLIFDATGRVSSCEITTSSGSAAADRAACAEARRQLSMPPPVSGSPGVAPAAVRTLFADFVAPPAPASVPAPR